jgi:uncharacterized protein YunC (DUF1805 family)
LIDGQAALEQRLGLGVAPLLVVQHRKIALHQGYLGMIGAVCPLRYLERALIQRL